jgi:predicted nucleotidyltransferase
MLHEPLRLNNTKIEDAIMEVSSIQEIVAYLKSNKGLLYDRFGVIRMGIFGSFVEDEQSVSSDIDMVVEFEKDKKNIHSFLQLKRFLEKELSRKVDLGFEHALKPIVRQNIKERITYV